MQGKKMVERVDRLTVDIVSNITSVVANKITGVVSAPDSITNRRLVRHKFIEQTPTKIVIDVFKVTFDPNVEREYSRSTILLTDDKVDFDQMEWFDDLPDWMLQIRDVEDLYKNPTNTLAHPYLDPEDVPMFESDHFYLSKLGHLYIKGVAGLWFRSSLDWVEQRKNDNPEIQRMFLAIELMK